MSEMELTPEQLEALEAERGRLERSFKFTHGHRVRYDEIDAQGVMGSGSWLNLLHVARVEYLRNLGLFLEGGGRAPIQLVVRRVGAEFLAPARFDDAIILRVRVAQLGNSSCRFEYLVDNGAPLRLLVAETLMVCIEVESQRSIALPLILRERIAEYEAENLIIGHDSR
jgi:acyl-CoA thioester hydrolase